MGYHVVLTQTAERAVGELPRQLRARIRARLATLADNPRPPGCVKLSGQDAYRVRVGDYRIIYTIEDDKLIVLVIDVGHRRDVYRRR